MDLSVTNESYWLWCSFKREHKFPKAINRLQCSASIAFVNSKKPKNSLDSLYCSGMEMNTQYLDLPILELGR